MSQVPREAEEPMLPPLLRERQVQLTRNDLAIVHRARGLPPAQTVPMRINLFITICAYDELMQVQDYYGCSLSASNYIQSFCR